MANAYKCDSCGEYSDNFSPEEYVVSNPNSTSGISYVITAYHFRPSESGVGGDQAKRDLCIPCLIEELSLLLESADASKNENLFVKVQ